MDIYGWLALGTFVFPIFGGLITYIWNMSKGETMSRLDKIETRLQQAVTEDEVRQIINDKLDHIQEDVKEIKTDLRRLFSLYVNSKNLRPGESS